MAFTYFGGDTAGATSTVDATSVKRILGTYVNTAGSTGGTINTGLSVVKHMFLQPQGTTVVSMPTVNGTFPITVANGAVVIVTNANETGAWEAIGY